MLQQDGYRFVRSIGGNATLHAVTFPGIDDFLASDDAGDGGLVMLLTGPRGGETGGLHGGPVVGEILREMKGLPDSMKIQARPIAVVTLAGAEGRGEVAERMARRLMSRVAGGELVGDLGAFEALVDDLARAIPHVLGVDPFTRAPALN